MLRFRSVETGGIIPGSEECLLTWTPIVGPSCIAVWRVLDLMARTGTRTVDYATLGVCAGVGQDRCMHTVERLKRFHLITEKDGILAIPTAAPQPTRQQKERIRVKYAEALAKSRKAALAQ